MDSEISKRNEEEYIGVMWICSIVRFGNWNEK